MDINLFFNLNYIKKKYKNTDKNIEKYLSDVLPSIVNRISSDSRVNTIRILTQDLNEENIGYGSKVKIIKFDSNNIENYNDLIKKFTNEIEIIDEVVVIYNPLFPFININKIYQAYQNIKNLEFDSSMGIDHFYSDSFDEKSLRKFDKGIFNIFNKNDFKASNERLNGRVFSVNLSALELVSLRETEDYELFSLIINSGFIQ